MVPLIALWLGAALLIRSGMWAGILLTLPAGAFLVRLFLIQHDCGHGSFFRSRSANGWVGRTIGILTLTPYEFWRRAHAHHHAGAGNLDRRGLGDIDTLTLNKFKALGAWGRWRYRAYRHPLVMLGIGPGYQFVIRHRLPFGMMRGGRRPWISTMGTNVAALAAATALILAIGPTDFLAVQVPVTLVAASLGVWLFYVQHQFDGTTWMRAKQWSFVHAALHGSSWYRLPPILRWFSANVGVHHVHHLCSGIPFYRLTRALKAIPELRQVECLTLLQSIRTTRLALWDEERARMISFKDARFA